MWLQSWSDYEWIFSLNNEQNWTEANMYSHLYRMCFTILEELIITNNLYIYIRVTDPDMNPRDLAMFCLYLNII